MRGLFFCWFFTVFLFYRDLLPFTLKLPQAILEANSFQDLEIISSLGIGKSLKAARVSVRLVRIMVPRTDIMQLEDRSTIVFRIAEKA